MHLYPLCPSLWHLETAQRLEDQDISPNNGIFLLTMGILSISSMHFHVVKASIPFDQTSILNLQKVGGQVSLYTPWCLSFHKSHRLPHDLLDHGGYFWSQYSPNLGYCLGYIIFVNDGRYCIVNIIMSCTPPPRTDRHACNKTVWRGGEPLFHHWNPTCPNNYTVYISIPGCKHACLPA